MAVKIRLARGGAKKRPFYRVVVADARSPRDGKFIEKLGTYNPLVESSERVKLDVERVKYWLGQGAIPSERVEGFLVSSGLLEHSKKSQALLAARIEKVKRAKEAAAAAAEAEAKAAAEQEAAA